MRENLPGSGRSKIMVAEVSYERLIHVILYGGAKYKAIFDRA